MSIQVKKRIFAGAVCDQVIYQAEEGQRIESGKTPRLRFKTDAERDAHKLAISKRYHAMLINANFGPTSCYSTLTFDDEHEVYNFEDARRLRNNYIKRLRRRYPNAKLAIYMGRGKSTFRIHLHMISEGVPKEDIIGLWGYGTICDCRHLRERNIDKSTGINHGRDYTNVANYCFDHWTPEQGKGKRYYHTNNFIRPEEEKPTICVLHYDADHPPRPPKGYIYTGDCFITQYGYMRFRYVMDPHPRE